LTGGGMTAMSDQWYYGHSCKIQVQYHKLQDYSLERNHVKKR